MVKKLVIVESPAKARTISGILGRDFAVESSIGHVRDLPPTAADIPTAYKGEPWARLGVDVDNDFKPLYVVPKDKKAHITRLRAALKDADELYLATDEDREGESIAWHLLEVLSPRIPVRRMVFHEITPQAIQSAVAAPRDLDRRLVDAQEARRILDRLFGYGVSPVLWKKVLPKLSAGRVQSVATRIVVERERARIAFRSATYWGIEGSFTRADPETASDRFAATLVSVDGSRIATGKDFSEVGEIKRPDVVVLDEDRAERLRSALDGAAHTVRSVEEKPYTRSPYAPFITSTLQQEASRKLGFGSKRAMQVAQRLYENGYITYMRTDSTTLSDAAVDAARSAVRDVFGSDYLPDRPRRYKSKVKNAQEAHEAIRPAGDFFRKPQEVSAEVSADEARLYELIWMRTLASQMKDATGNSLQVRIGAISSDNDDVEFAASGRTITFPGFLRAYVEGADDPEAQLEDREVRLPQLAVGETVVVLDLQSRSHSTQPPARFTEASLVKRLEELGVGRPSTYASIMGTIQDRGYVWKKGSALVPSFVAFATIGLLEKHFAKLVDYGFTAAMEDDLDKIAVGEEEAIPWLRKFYFGNGKPGLKALVSEDLDQIDAREVNSFSLGRDAEGHEVVVRVGRFGPYLQRAEDRASVPEDLAPDELTLAKAQELLDAPSEDRLIGTDPETSLPVVLKSGRYGPYVQLGEQEEGSKSKPRTASLLRSMDPSTVTLEDALRLLSLPRLVGEDPDGEAIYALNGRYGPYLKKGSDTRALADENQIFQVTLPEALELFAQPKRGRGRTSATTLKELGEDPETGAPIVVKDGRFGPYITDGKVNVSVPKTASVEEMTLQRAAELLVDKRKNPTPKRRKRK